MQVMTKKHSEGSPQNLGLCFKKGNPVFKKGNPAFKKGFTGTLLNSLFLLGYAWTHLKPCVLLGFQGLARTLAPGSEHGKQPENHVKTSINNIRTHQECPEHIQEAPQRLHDLAEQLSIPFRDTSQAPKPRARGTKD